MSENKKKNKRKVSKWEAISCILAFGIIQIVGIIILLVYLL